MMIQAFEAWGQTQIPVLCEQPFEDYQLRHSWESLIDQCNKSIREYGFVHGVKLGTTVVALLVTPNRYYLLNIGDSRAYEITETNIMQLTEDQTLVNSEVKKGKITREQAVIDSRRNVLLQCIGVNQDVIPDLFFGTPEKNAVYMLCTDGFYHKLLPEEMACYLSPGKIERSEQLDENSRYLMELIKQRGERDNITVASVKIFK